MKIVFNNNTELKWFTGFLDLVNESDGLDALIEHMQKIHGSIPVGYREFIELVLFRHPPVEVSETEPEVEFDEASFLTGVCPICGTKWEGIDPDLGPFTVTDIEHYLRENTEGKGYCAECFINNRCVECGEHHPDHEIDRSEDGPVCRFCSGGKVNNAWGCWDDDGERLVRANGVSKEKAIEILRGYDGDEAVIKYVDGPVMKEVWDCEYGGPQPCNDPGCLHNHKLMVWVFDVYTPDTWEG